MSSNLDVYHKYVEATWANPPESLIDANVKYLSDDYKVYDENGNVIMDKAAYIGMAKLLGAGFPDIKGVYGEVREEGDEVIIHYHFEGTFTGDLDLSPMGLGVIPASGKKIVWPDDTVVFQFKGDKIVGNRPYGKSGGIAAFLAVLGVKPPSG